MGRKRKNKEQQQQQQQQRGNSSSNSKKRRRKNKSSGRKYWIQDCPDLVGLSSEEDEQQPTAAAAATPATTATTPDLLVWLSTADLEDAHTHHPPHHHNQNDRKVEQSSQQQKATAARGRIGCDRKGLQLELELEGSNNNGNDNNNNSSSGGTTAKKSVPNIAVPALSQKNASTNQQKELQPAGEDEVYLSPSSPPGKSSPAATPVRCKRPAGATRIDTMLMAKKEEEDGDAGSSSSWQPVQTEDSLQEANNHSTNVNNNPPEKKPIIYIRRAPRHHSHPQHPHHYNSSKNKPFRPLPHGDCGDGILNPFPQTTVLDKYWAQRKRLFTRFDDGIQLDADGWFSVTPEAIANHIAERMMMVTASATTTTTTNNSSKTMVVLDAFAGVGGNTIALARRPEVQRVIAVDTCRERLRRAAHNCRVYEIPSETVVFVHGDACRVLECYRDGRARQQRVEEGDNDGKGGNKNINTAVPDAKTKAQDDTASTVAGLEKTQGDDDNDDKKEAPDLLHGYSLLTGTDHLASQHPSLDSIFLSPPWGGSDYEQIGPRHYSLDCIQLENTANGVDLLRLALAALPADRLNLAYFLPRNLNGLTLAQNCYDCGVRGCIEMEQNVLNQKLKTITVYIDSNGNDSNNDTIDINSRTTATTRRLLAKTAKYAFI